MQYVVAVPLPTGRGCAAADCHRAAALPFLSSTCLAAYGFLVFLQASVAIGTFVNTGADFSVCPWGPKASGESSHQRFPVPESTWQGAGGFWGPLWGSKRGRAREGEIGVPT